MSKKKCCVVLITHKNSLEGNEERSFKQAIKIFSERDIYIVIPGHVNELYYQSFGNNVKIMKVPDDWLKSYMAYNRTLELPYFYNLFEDYDYILIYQSDCWAFYDNLDYFVNLDYDYYGAPWSEPWYFGGNVVGNGGFSLRKVHKMIDLTNNHKNDEHNQFEDQYFCVQYRNELNICDTQTALKFSVESLNESLCNCLFDIPMGLHGKDNIKYWDDSGENFNKFLINYK